MWTVASGIGRAEHGRVDTCHAPRPDELVCAPKVQRIASHRVGIASPVGIAPRRPRRHVDSLQLSGEPER